MRRLFRNRKLRSFTLVEIVVTMIISLIVMGLTYSGYFMVRSQLGSDDFHSAKDAAWLKYTLDYAFFKSGKAEWKEDTLVFRDTCIVSRFYFNPSQVLIYHAGNIDTVKVVTDSVKVEYVPDTKLVSGFEYLIVTKPENERYRFTKQYPAETLFNAKNISFEY